MSLICSGIFFNLLFNPDNVSEMVVTWSTMDDSAESIVEYGINGFTLTAEGESKKFVDGGNAKHTQYIHKVDCSVFDVTAALLPLFD